MQFVKEKKKEGKEVKEKAGTYFGGFFVGGIFAEGDFCQGGVFCQRGISCGGFFAMVGISLIKVGISCKGGDFCGGEGGRGEGRDLFWGGFFVLRY